MLYKILLFIWILSLSFGQLSLIRRDIFGGVYIFDILALFWVFVVSFGLLVSEKTRLYVPRLYFWFITFLFIALISFVMIIPRYSTTEILYSGFYFVRLLVYVYGGILVWNLLHENMISEGYILKLIMFSGIFLVFGGLIQMIFLPDLGVLDQALGWDPHQNRLVSTFLDPNFLGAYLVICFNFVIAFRKDLERYFYPLLLVFSGAVMLTFSRSAWMAAGISVFIWGILKYRLLLLIALLIGFGAYYTVPRVQTRIAGLTDPDDSAHFRLISWRKTLAIFSDHPVLGVGYNTFRFVQRDYGYFDLDWGGKSGAGSDSSLLLILATTGVAGAIPFAIFLTLPVLGAIIVKDRSNWDLLALASIPALLAGSFFINSLFYPQIMFLWNIVLTGLIFSRTQR